MKMDVSKLTEKRVRVFVSGPISVGNTFANVRRAIRAGELLKERGYLVYVPHLMALAEMIHPVGREARMNYDLYELVRCDVLIRLSGTSQGADDEWNLAALCNIPCFEISDPLDAVLVLSLNGYTPNGEEL